MSEDNPFMTSLRAIKKQPVSIEPSGEVDAFGDLGVKKKVSTSDVKNTSKPSLIGGLNDQNFLQGGNDTPIQPTPVTPKGYVKPVNDYPAIMDGLKAYSSKKKPTQQELYNEDPMVVSARENSIKKAQDDHEQAIVDKQISDYKKKHGDGFWSGVGMGATFLASKAIKGVLPLAESAAYAIEKTNPMAAAIEPEMNHYLDKANEASNLGLNEDYHGMGAIDKAVGGLAEFAPQILAAESTGGASYFLGGVGNAHKEVRKLKEQGATFENGADDLYTVGSGIANYLLMNKLPISKLLSKMPASLRESVVGKVSMDALKQAANSGGKVTAEALVKPFQEASMKFSQKALQGGVNFIKDYAHTAKDLSILTTADAALKSVSNTVSGNENFKQTPEDLFNNIKNILTSEAPAFAALGGVIKTAQDPGALFRQSPVRNEAISSIKEDMSPENLAQIKDDLVQHGQEQGWSPNEIENSVKTADVLHEAVKSIPKEFGDAKFNKAVDLITGRKELQDQLSEIKASKEGIDESIRDVPTKEESLVQAKLDQSNDKLRELATDKKFRYNFDEEKDAYTKQLGEKGKAEEITKDRYELEQLEKDFKKQKESVGETPVVTTENRSPESPDQEVVNAPKVGEGVSSEKIEPIINEQPSETIPVTEAVQPTSSETAKTPVSESDVKVDKVEPTENGSVSIKNADVEERRDKYGLPELTDRKGITEDEANNLATEAINNGYNARDLVDAVLDEGKNTSAVENTILNKHQAYLDVEYNRLKTEIENYEGGKSGLDKLLEEKDRADQEYDRTMQASVRAGTINSDALRSRQWTKEHDYSLSGMYEKMYKVDPNRKPLTSEEREFTREKFNEMKAKLAEYESAKDSNIDTLAEKAWKKLQQDIALEKRRSIRIEKKSEIDKSIDDTLKSLRSKIRSQSSTLSANPVPIEAFTDIAKLAKLYAKRGTLDFAQVIDSLYNDLKNEFTGLNKSHIKEILALTGRDSNEVRLDNFKTRTKTNIANVRERINKGDYQKKVLEGLDLDKEAKELRDEYERMKFKFDEEVERKRLANRTLTEEAGDITREVTGIFRAVKATLDLSFPLRQGKRALLSHPVRWSQALKDMHQIMLSENKYDSFLNDLKYADDYQIIKDSGLEITSAKTAKLSAKEEEFQTNILGKLPIIGNAKLLDGIKGVSDGNVEVKFNGKKYRVPLGTDLVEMSDRAYSTFATSLRVRLFRDAEKELSQYYSGAELDKALKARARDINNLTGRADIGSSEKAKALGSVAFFSPRYIVSQIRNLTNIVNPIWWKSTPKEVRKMYFKESLLHIATVGSILGAASAMGYKIVTNPNDPDYLKIKDPNGKTRTDITGGTLPYIRQTLMLIQLARGIKPEGAKYKLETINQRGNAMMRQLGHFVRGKLAPLPAIGVNLYEGKDYIGNDYGITSIPKEFIPLAAGDISGILKEEPNLKGAIYSALQFYGEGTSTYNTSKKH